MLQVAGKVNFEFTVFVHFLSYLVGVSQDRELANTPQSPNSWTIATDTLLDTQAAGTMGLGEHQVRCSLSGHPK